MADRPHVRAERPCLGVLISGRGSNLQAMIDAIRDGRLDARIGLVISNKADASGLSRATEAGLDTLVLSHKAFPSRETFDLAMAEALRERRVDLVCLAGFMRLLSPAFIAAFPGRILNIHPALLPSFPGLDAQRQALEHGVRVTGATVHFVDADLDAGPIVAQAAVPVRDGDTEDLLAARILIEEHRIYPEAIQRVLEGGWRIEGRRVIWGLGVGD
ncbi:MAG: phosphoribosylglycinamide formyltransferase [Vicinamibacterales bacterium]|nr:phosphoribosylglycinamide formyltransferase [Vicinamibacterales bacterium]